MTLITPCTCQDKSLLLQLLLRCVAVIVTAMASNPWVVIPAVILVISFLALRWYYLRTSREVKRLEAIGTPKVCFTNNYYTFKVCLHFSSESCLFPHCNNSTWAANDQVSRTAGCDAGPIPHISEPTLTGY